MSHIMLTRVSPMTTIQDDGRPGKLIHGISASGPMDRYGYAHAATVAAAACGAAIEIGPLGMDFIYSGASMNAGLAGGKFALDIDGISRSWPAPITLSDGMSVSIKPGPEGNYAYLRFAAEIGVPEVLGSRATNATVGLGGLEGRALRIGDRLELVSLTSEPPEAVPHENIDPEAPVRFIWGIHADLFSSEVRQAFTTSNFRISARMDRMGVRIEDREGVFARAGILSLVSNAVVPGDIQILGDGTPIVLMRDHQPTGGYPRIGTIIDADLDRFAQLRPGREIRFTPVTVGHAHKISGWIR